MLRAVVALSVASAIGHAQSAERETRVTSRFPPVQRRAQYYPADPTEDEEEKPKNPSTVNVNLPLSLHKGGNGYEHSDALFGKDVLGISLAEKVYYAGGDLCDVGNSAEFTAPYMLIVNRGNCTFVHKARNAQTMGASAIVLVDHTCECDDKDAGICKDDNGDDGICEFEEPTMSDDGSGDDIRIPVVMLKKQDGEAIIKSLNRGTPVSMGISFPVPNPDDRVEWNLWSTALDTDDLATFKETFGPIAEQFGKHAFFEPFYFIYNGTEFACTHGPGEEAPCGDLCTNRGMYCYPDPDGIHDYGLSGADIVRESLRQKCVYEEYGNTKAKDEEKGVATKWWTYVSTFQKNCANEDSFTKSSCIQDAMKAAGIDSHRVDSCIQTSGGFRDADGANDILEREVKEKLRQQISVLPTYNINETPMRGRVRAADVFYGICSGYAPDTEPQPLCSCTSESTATDIEECAGIGTPVPQEQPVKVVKEGMSGGAVFGTVVLVLAVVGGGGFAYYKYNVANVRNEVRDLLAEYMPLDDANEALA